MKEHLVNLLFEEYKQQCLFDELVKKGVELAGICVNNLDIIIDIVGFPKDTYIDKNTVEYDFNFSRDILMHQYYEVYRLLAAQQKIFVSPKGLEIESGADTETVKQNLLEYVNWLYEEFEKWENGEYE
ncbi:hypothetical protein [Emticicia sp.]|uniref:hypothetical protein n=1 Tax=Emticicia sp. TaxID=1930953 RepID=UPI003752F90C